MILRLQTDLGEAKKEPASGETDDGLSLGVERQVKTYRSGCRGSENPSASRIIAETGNCSSQNLLKQHFYAASHYFFPRPPCPRKSTRLSAIAGDQHRAQVPQVWVFPSS